jgi:hypothetical protein
MQTELTQTGPLLNPDGRLAQVGWSRQPILNCNLEAAHFYTLRPLQRFRTKRWDYYAVFSQKGFFSATIADLGYAGNLLAKGSSFRVTVSKETAILKMRRYAWTSAYLHPKGGFLWIGRNFTVVRE